MLHVVSNIQVSRHVYAVPTYLWELPTAHYFVVGQLPVTHIYRGHKSALIKAQPNLSDCIFTRNSQETVLLLRVHISI